MISMLMQNVNRRVGLGNGLYYYSDSNVCLGLSVCWVKVLVFVMLAECYPEDNIIHVDTDAVMAEELLQRVVSDKIPMPTISNASDLGSPHNTGLYTLYRHPLGRIETIPALPEAHEYTGSFIDNCKLQNMKHTTHEMVPNILSDPNNESYEECLQVT